MSGPIDRHTVDQLVLQHLPVALRLARRLTHDGDLAEDVVQEALCRVLARWNTFRGDASFSTWMLQIVVNVVRDVHRRQPNRPTSCPENIADASASALQQAEAAELDSAIRRAISNLPPRQREVAVLSFGERLPARDIADILEITEQNVHTCIHLARKQIAKSLGLDNAGRHK